MTFPIEWESQSKFHGSSHQQPVYYPMGLSPILIPFLYHGVKSPTRAADFFIPGVRLVGDTEKYDVINGGNK
jgi:hypothetical protein